MSQYFFEAEWAGAATALTRFGLSWLLQSTLLLAGGLAICRLVKRKGAACQSAVLRATLLAVLVCPLATWTLARAGVSGWSIASREEPRAPVEAANAETSPALPLPDVDLPLAEPMVAEDPSTPVVVEQDQIVVEPSNAANAVPLEIEVPAPRESQVLHWTPAILCGAWISIVLILVARLVVAWRRLARVQAQAVSADTAAVDECRVLARRIGVEEPRVLHAPCLPSPCLAGLRRPAILLPDDIHGLSLREVLIHELAHLHRRDCGWNLLRHLATAFFFFQPLLWWLSSWMEAAAEEVCDDYVVEFGGNRKRYANGLVQLAELTIAPASPVGVGIVSLRSVLAKRVERILDHSRTPSVKVGRLFVIGLVVVGLVGTTAMGFVGLEPRTEETPPVNSAEPEDETPAGRPTEPEEHEAGAAAAVPAKPVTVVAAAQASTTARAEEQATDDSIITGQVVGADGKPIAGAEFYWMRSRVHDLDLMKPRLLATTDNQGNYQLTLPALGLELDAPARWSYMQWMVVRADGHGFVTERPSQLRRKREESGTLLGTLANAFTGRKGITITLPDAGEPLRGRIVNIDGQPVAGATVRVRWFTDGQSFPHEQRDAEARGDENPEWQARISRLLGIIEPANMQQVLPSATTDENGRFVLKDIGQRRLLQLVISGPGVETVEVIARNGPGEVIEFAPGRHRSREKTHKVYPSNLTLALGPSIPITGRVTDADSGEPIANAIVRAYTIHGDRLYSSREREQFATRTDADGNYRISGMPRGSGNQIVAFTTDDQPFIPAGARVDTGEGQEAVHDFQLRKGIWARGRVYDAESGSPFTGEITYHYFQNGSTTNQFPGLRRAFLDGCYWTNSRGEFSVPVLPTRGILAFRYDGSAFDRDGIDRYPPGYGVESIEGAEELGGLLQFMTRPTTLVPTNYQRLVEVNPTASDKVVSADMPLALSPTVEVRVLDEQGSEVAGCRAYGAARNWGWQSFDTATIEIRGLKPGERRKVFVYHRKRNLAGSATVDTSNRDVVEVRLQEAGSISGRLVDAGGAPITDATVTADYEKLWTEGNEAAIWAPHPNLRANPTKIPVDEEGRFLVDGLIPGKLYSARASAPRKLRGTMMDYGIGKVFVDQSIEPGETKELGDIVIESTR